MNCQSGRQVLQSPPLLSVADRCFLLKCRLASLPLCVTNCESHAGNDGLARGHLQSLGSASHVRSGHKSPRQTDTRRRACRRLCANELRVHRASAGAVMLIRFDHMISEASPAQERARRRPGNSQLRPHSSVSADSICSVGRPTWAFWV